MLRTETSVKGGQVDVAWTTDGSKPGRHRAVLRLVVEESGAGVSWRIVHLENRVETFLSSGVTQSVSSGRVR